MLIKIFAIIVRAALIDLGLLVMDTNIVALTRQNTAQLIKAKQGQTQIAVWIC